MQKKLGLVLGAGGARGIAHIGFLQALDEHGIKPHCISGCSMGSVVGGLYAKGLAVSEIKDFMLKVKSSDVFDFNAFAIFSGSLLKTKKMRNLLAKQFGDVTFEDLNIPFCCNAFNMKDGKSVYFNEGSVLEAVIASSSIPTVFKASEYNDGLFIDGGLTDRVPVTPAREMGAEAIVVVDVLGKLREEYVTKNMITHILRIVDALDWHNTNCKYENEKIDLVLMPELGTMSQYLVKQLDFAYEKGYEIGLANIDKIKQIINF